MKVTFAIAVTMVILGAFPSRGRASLIEIAITAEITAVQDSGGLLDGNVNAGDTITGSYIYDSEAIDTEPSNPYKGLYKFTQSPYGISLATGGFLFKTDPSNVDFTIGVINDKPPLINDIFGLDSDNNLPLHNGVPVRFISWQLDDLSGQAISSINLPIAGMDIEDWHDFNFLLISGGGDPQEGQYAFGISARVTLAVLIPEPATLMMLSLGMLHLGTKRRPVSVRYKRH
ncbi:MAG: PEP-CTERM sorting domain-containing protein [Sedimentisphaerales bacterium]|nr:PEP-CTERM sorting domain-containing protein [Sedimentisphaerales bacterium]